MGGQFPQGLAQGRPYGRRGSRHVRDALRRGGGGPALPGVRAAGFRRTGTGCSVNGAARRTGTGRQVNGVARRGGSGRHEGGEAARGRHRPAGDDQSRRGTARADRGGPRDGGGPRHGGGCGVRGRRGHLSGGPLDIGHRSHHRRGHGRGVRPGPDGRGTGTGAGSGTGLPAAPPGVGRPAPGDGRRGLSRRPLRLRLRPGRGGAQEERGSAGGGAGGTRPRDTVDEAHRCGRQDGVAELASVRDVLPRGEPGPEAQSVAHPDRGPGDGHGGWCDPPPAAVPVRLPAHGPAVFLSRLGPRGRGAVAGRPGDGGVGLPPVSPAEPVPELHALTRSR